MKNKAADAPITFEEIEMVMIDQINDSGPLHEIYEWSMNKVIWKIDWLHNYNNDIIHDYDIC